MVQGTRHRLNAPQEVQTEEAVQGGEGGPRKYDPRQPEYTEPEGAAEKYPVARTKPANQQGLDGIFHRWRLLDSDGKHTH